ncbi:hypothetical protein [Hankyongella ginsenosidimutans]|uniref:hypothetical protein n=1 Tax=Hankyongella ginsenosidimutans TaxID=1763828 RepID=UPI001FE7F4F0|nr:hypothetical protein [Hankyongella ginsenosidimutans]
MTQDLSALLDRLRRGGMIVLTGDRLRGGDIDFAVAAEHATRSASTSWRNSDAA